MSNVHELILKNMKIIFKHGRQNTTTASSATYQKVLLY
jgi:hypothetical protein